MIETIFTAFDAALIWIYFGSIVTYTDTPLKDKIFCATVAIIISALSLIILFFAVQNLKLTIYNETVIIIIMIATWVVSALVSHYYVEGRWE